MFYTLSKALLFAISPVSWVLIAVILSLLSRRRYRKVLYRNTAIAVFILFSNTYLYEFAIAQLEMEHLPITTERFDYGILLGGYGEHNTYTDRIELYRSADRLTEAAALLQQNRIDTLIISSGVHEDGAPENNEARMTLELYKRLGLDSSRLILEEASWNTFQNAERSKELIKEQEEPVLLITSAFHMKRAIACFEKQGLRVRPYTVDHILDKEPSTPLSYYLIPSFNTLISWQIPLKEWIGTVVYRLKGYI